MRLTTLAPVWPQIMASFPPTAANHCSAQPSNPYADVKTQKTFEKGLLEKTGKQNGDIILYDNRIVLYKSESDVNMYIVGGQEENEVLLYNVVLALRDGLHLLFKYVCSNFPFRPSKTGPSKQPS